MYKWIFLDICLRITIGISGPPEPYTWIFKDILSRTWGVAIVVFLRNVSKDFSSHIRRSLSWIFKDIFSRTWGFKDNQGHNRGISKTFFKDFKDFVRHVFKGHQSHNYGFFLSIFSKHHLTFNRRFLNTFFKYHQSNNHGFRK